MTEADDFPTDPGSKHPAEVDKPGAPPGRSNAPDNAESTEAAARPPKSAPSLPEVREATKSHARDLASLLLKYVQYHLPPSQPDQTAAPDMPRMTGKYAVLLPFLQLIPWGLGALFLLSFFWDFPDWQVSLFGQVYPLDGILRITSVSGLIGFLTNWLAITMLFNPREKRPIFGQGLIPAQRERVIYRLAQAVSKELINEKIIKEKIEESGVIQKYRETAMMVTRGVLEDPGFRLELKHLTADYLQSVLGSEEVRGKIIAFVTFKLEQYAEQGFSGLALKAYRYFNEADFQRRIQQAVHELPASLDIVLDQMDRMLDQIPAKIEERSETIETWATKAVLSFVEKIDVYKIITSNMERYDERQLENLLKKTSNEQLNYIKYLGGILGLLGGLVIWRPLLALIVFSITGLILYAVDEALFRSRKRRTA